jgi:phosphoglycolate phosphatase
MKYQLVMFDFDGTLADSFPLALSAAKEIAEQFRLKPLRPEELEALRYHSAAWIIKQLKIPLWKLPLMVRRSRAIMAREIRRVPLFDGMPRVLAELSRQGTVLAVVSSNSLTNVRRVLGPENAERIRHYECGVSLFGKPARIRSVLRRSGVGPDRAIFIGDEIRDGEAARATGVAFGAVGWGFTRVEALTAETPDLVFQRPADILQALGAG